MCVDHLVFLGENEWEGTLAIAPYVIKRKRLALAGRKDPECFYRALGTCRGVCLPSVSSLAHNPYETSLSLFLSLAPCLSALSVLFIAPFFFSLVSRLLCFFVLFFALLFFYFHHFRFFVFFFFLVWFVSRFFFLILKGLPVHRRAAPSLSRRSYLVLTLSKRTRGHWTSSTSPSKTLPLRPMLLAVTRGRCPRSGMIRSMFWKKYGNTSAVKSKISSKLMFAGLVGYFV